jgi:hypothetical protein
MYFRCVWTRNLKEDSEYGFQLAHMLYNYGDNFSGMIQMNENGVKQVQSILKQRKELKCWSSYHTKQKMGFHSTKTDNLSSELMTGLEYQQEMYKPIIREEHVNVLEKHGYSMFFMGIDEGELIPLEV